MKKIFLICFSVIISQPLFAQEEIRCRSFEQIQKLKAENPAYENMFEQSEIFLQHYISTHKINSRSIITIPVVVHLLYNVDSQNHKISDWQITSQIDALNEDYRLMNADRYKTPSLFDSIAADCEINFCLAKRDPNGNATTGIRRVATPYTVFTDFNSPKQTANGGDDPWPYTDYLNIWVCPLVYPELGYSTFPSASIDAASDGVVCHFKAFGRINVFSTKYKLGRTITHETGHWLNLIHIWGDASGCGTDDNVGDTPLQDAEHYQCIPFPFVSCVNSGDMSMNYMDYSRDSCMNIFTAGQKQRMVSAINLFRSSILNSTACNAVGTFSFDIGITKIIHPDYIVSGGSITPVVTLHNFGSQIITSCEINYEKNWKSNLNVFNWSGSLAPDASLDVTLPAIADSNWYNIFCAWTKNPNGNQDADTTNDFKTHSYYSISDSVNSIQEISNHNNPEIVFLTNSFLTIEIYNIEFTEKNILVYNSLGQVVEMEIYKVAENKYRFNFSQNTSGIYYIRFSDSNNSIVKRVLVQHDF